uniref:Uncharacterized protein n=1 Tax=Haptolina ericina TaxID=156174 RepID=A0A7S3AZ69_9EUKA
MDDHGVTPTWLESWVGQEAKEPVAGSTESPKPEKPESPIAPPAAVSSPVVGRFSRLSLARIPARIPRLDLGRLFEGFSGSSAVKAPVMITSDVPEGNYAPTCTHDAELSSSPRKMRRVPLESSMMQRVPSDQDMAKIRRIPSEPELADPHPILTGIKVLGGGRTRSDSAGSGKASPELRRWISGLAGPLRSGSTSPSPINKSPARASRLSHGSSKPSYLSNSVRQQIQAVGNEAKRSNGMGETDFLERLERVERLEAQRISDLRREEASSSAPSACSPHSLPAFTIGGVMTPYSTPAFNSPHSSVASGVGSPPLKKPSPQKKVRPIVSKKGRPAAAAQRRLSSGGAATPAGSAPSASGRTPSSKGKKGSRLANGAASQMAAGLDKAAASPSSPLVDSPVGSPPSSTLNGSVEMGAMDDDNPWTTRLAAPHLVVDGASDCFAVETAQAGKAAGACAEIAAS